MKPTHYATISEAVNALNAQGFTTDFRLAYDQLTCPQTSLRAGEFRIVDVYRYEGDSDPADEAIVYAIESQEGLKGVLVMGYGVSDDPVSDEMLAELKRI
nr:hypothetical protein [uncultured Arsenicibacter sp.]